MEIKKEHLLNSLEVARMGVAGSDHLEQLGHFIFGGEHLITFNNRILIYHPLKTDFQCSVRSEVFYKQLQKFDTEDLTIELKKARLVIKGKRESARLGAELAQDSELFEVIDFIRKEQLKVKYVTVPEKFVQAVEFCGHSASKNAADGTLCCVCIDGDTIISNDNYRATRYVMDKDMTTEQVLLDARVANEIKRFKMTHFGIGKNWLHFKNEAGVLLSARQIFGDYPDLSESFSFRGQILYLPDETRDILDFVGVLVADEQEPEKVADIEVKDGYITASVDKVTDVSEKSIELDKRYKDLEMKFRVNINFLRQVLDRTTTLIYNLEEQKGMFKTTGFKHILRLAPPEKEAEKVEKIESTEPATTDPYDDDIPF
jgi:hypothetical protein